MKYLLIENIGEISVDSLILMGGTSKRESSNLIGFYGSGNKYAIATLLNAKVPFKIFSGEKEIEITTKEHNFRGTTLNRICIDGEETSLTTSMGPEWKLWFGIRELYANSIDEGRSNVVLSTEDIQPKKDYTRIYIGITPEIQVVINDWDNYFTFDRTDMVCEARPGKIFPNTDPANAIIYYRRGIRCEHSKGPALYQYDLKDVEINESRVCSNQYQAKFEIAGLLNEITDVRILKDILRNASKDNMFENSLYWDCYNVGKLSPTFKEAIGNYRIIPEDRGGYFVEEQQKFDCYVVSLQLAKKIKTSFPDVIVYGLKDDGSESIQRKSIEPNNKMKFLLKEVNKFFEEANYVVDYPIEIVSFSKEETLGQAENGTIYISDKQFDKGKKEIAATIIEENEHLKTKYKDATRAFQNHFINLFLSQMEERICNFL